MNDRQTDPEQPHQPRADRWLYVEAWGLGLAYAAVLLGALRAWFPW